MKGDLVTKAPVYQKLWSEKNIYQARLTLNQHSPSYILHDGPPYANGSIHIGHALNKILKDFIVRLKSLQGFYTPYIPGWDCHGLPIENQIEKLNKETYKTLSPSSKRLQCQTFAEEQLQMQLSQFKQLNLLTDFSQTYTTSSKEYISNQLDVFLELCSKNLLYYDLKPVFWSWSSKTTLAESEIIYQDVTENSIYLTFPLLNHPLDDLKDTHLLIWTTTPYTLEANLALALKPNTKYTLFTYKGKKYLCISSLYECLITKFGWLDSTKLSDIDASIFENHQYLNVITNETHQIYLADFVTDETGTGIVHCAPGFGHDDYILCLQKKIPIYCSINEGGCFIDQPKLKTLSGLFYQKASTVIVDYLKDNQSLVLIEPITHSVGHDWRTKKPTIFRATNQWFLNLRKLKDSIPQSFESLKTYPSWLSNKLKDQVLNREEWCLSRQRSWGVYIPMIFDGETPILDLDQIKHTVSILKKEGIESWNTKDTKHFLLDKYQHLTNPRKCEDIFDVWFDSGTSFMMYQNKETSIDLYLEGFDQLRGWFNSSSIIGQIQRGSLPFKEVIGHGFVLDGNGNKMSKSLGNVVDPLNIVNKYGSDILRLWVGLSNYFEDIKFTPESFETTISQYRKIRNTLIRYSLSVIKDQQIDETLLSNLQHPENIYIYSLFVEEFNKSLNEFSKYTFFKAIHHILNFVNVYSNWFLEISKDSLYCDEPNSSQYREKLSIISFVLNKCLIIFSIFIPQTSEEAYTFINKQDKKDSIFLETWPQPLTNIYTVDKHIWEAFFDLRTKVYSKIEEAKNLKVIGFISEVSLELSNDLLINLTPEQLKSYLNIAELNIISDKTNHINISKTTLTPCARCKKYPTNLNTFHNDQLCPRCLEIITTLPPN